jgi:hypothetical protein
MIKVVVWVLLDYLMFDDLPLLGLQIFHGAYLPRLDYVNIRFIIIWLIILLWKQLPTACPAFEVNVAFDPKIFGVNEGDAFRLEAILIDGACVFEYESPLTLLVIGNQA